AQALPRGHHRTVRRRHPHRARRPHLAGDRPVTDSAPSAGRELHPVVARVTDRLVDRSRGPRTAYLSRVRAAAETGPARGRLACANLAHGLAAADPEGKRALIGDRLPNIAIVSSYNDMLSAHQPYR